MTKKRRHTVTVALSFIAVACVVAVLVLWRRPEPQVHPPIDPAAYVGTNTCLSCHQDKKSFLGTAHHLTSALATGSTIAGSFHEGQNVLKTSNPYVYFRMDSTEDGFVQTAVEGMPPDTQSVSRQFDLVIGSGRKGQTYLYWEDGDRLFQLPVSYWTSLRAWVNSPGMREGVVNFNRFVTPRCLECHASAFESLPDSSSFANRYNPANYILGVSCEKCHGPGGEHVARQSSWRSRLAGSAIVNPADLSRQRQVEGCALCHGGIGEPQAPAFSYRPGEPLENYLHLSPPIPGEDIDVHGNQVALLARSPCFQSSDMTCSTCHNVHQPQRNAAAFSSTCLSCHKVQSCGLFPERGHELARNCVDCHMPNLPTGQIVSRNDGMTTQPKVRSHWIKVYPLVRTR